MRQIGIEALIIDFEEGVNLGLQVSFLIVKICDMIGCAHRGTLNGDLGSRPGSSVKVNGEDCKKQHHRINDISPSIAHETKKLFKLCN
jgi:hypothetical protein